MYIYIRKYILRCGAKKNNAHLSWVAFVEVHEKKTEKKNPKEDGYEIVVSLAYTVGMKIKTCRVS